MTTRSKPRRSSKALTEEECQAALNTLVDAMSDDFVAPIKAIAPSAVQLLVKRGVVTTPHRASYVLARLTEVGAIARIEHSHSYRITRKTVAIGRTPIMPAATQEAYEETILRLNDKLSEQRKSHEDEVGRLMAKLIEAQNLLVTANKFNERLEAELADLKGQLTKLDAPVVPTQRIREIMERELNV